MLVAGRSRVAMVGLVFSMLVAGGVLSGGQVSVQAASGVDPAKLGMYVGFDRGDRFSRFESELGSPIRYVVTMADSGSTEAMLSSVWGQFAKPDAYLPSVSNRVDVVLSVPLAFGPGGMGMTAAGQNTIRQNLQATAGGQLDSAYRLVARYLKEAGYGDAIIRLGHEFDGDWAPYSARNNNDAYIAAFRRVHDVFKSESSSFRLEWTAMDAHFIDYGPPAYPGDHYVDIVGLDIYWREHASPSDTAWNTRMKSVLVAHQSFAAAHGKPVSYPEWGRSLADETRFIDLMHGWLAGLPASGAGSLVYHSYFNEPGYLGEYDPYDLDKLPNVKRRFIELFGGSAPFTTPTPTTPAPATTSPATAYEPAQRGSSTTLSTSAPLSSPPPTTLVSTPSTASVAGTATKASISARLDGATLTAEWSHPEALNYIMRYKPVDSPWWIWRSQSLASSASISNVSPTKDYVVEVIVNIGGTWREWHTLQVSRTPSTSTSTTVAATSPTTVAPATSTTVATTRSASVAGNATQASISASIQGGTLTAKWSHPDALNYIMRYRRVDSPWWVWGPQSLVTSRSVSVAAGAGYVVEVITNIGGRWRQWNTVTIGAAS